MASYQNTPFFTENNIRDPLGSLKAKGSSKNCNVWVYSVIKHKQNTDNSSFSKPL